MFHIFFLENCGNLKAELELRSLTGIRVGGTVFFKCFVNALLAEVSPCFVMRCAGKWHLDSCIH